MIKYFCDITGKEVDTITDIVHVNPSGVKTRLSGYLLQAYPTARHIDVSLREKLEAEVPDYIAKADEQIVEQIKDFVNESV